MTLRSWLLFGSLVVLTAGIGLLAVHGAPDGGTAIGVWPVGLATAMLLALPRPRTPVVLVVVFATAVATIATERPTSVALGLGIALALETWLFWRLFTGGIRERPSLRSEAELGRYIVAAILGGLCAGLVAALTSVVTGWSDPLLLGLALGISGAGSNLAVAPTFCRLRRRPAVATPPERLLQWVMILTLTPTVFALDDFPSLVFALIPLLTWSALRSTATEALAQLYTLLGIAIVLTTRGHGPFAAAATRFDLSMDVQGILLALFVVDCSLVVVPFVLIVGEQVENGRQAAAERDMVQNIVRGMTAVAVIGTDELGRITLFNPGAERLLGYSAAEVEGQLTRMLHSPDGIAEKAAELGVSNDFGAVAAAMMGKGATTMRFVRKDGEERSHWMSLNRVVDDRGVTTGYVSTSEDITERVAAENKLVEALSAEREAVERLREVDHVKDAFVSSVSHELRTPITSILGYTEMLEDGAYGPLGVDQLDAVHRLAVNSSRLLGLIDDLLTLSRVQEDGIGFDNRVVDLRKVVAAAVAVVAPTLEQRELELDVDLPSEPLPFLGDRDMLERVVINLVGNAVKFTPEGGRVEVSLVADHEAAEIAVRDTGIGIPREEQEQLFSRFFRSSLAQQQAIPGSGLGLSIAHAIVEKHGGSILVESEPGEGTVFRVRLPLIVAVQD